MDAEAQAVASRHYPHRPPALLAHLYRAGQRFPPMLLPRRSGDAGWDAIMAIHPNCAGRVMDEYDGGYCEWTCKRCPVILWTENTDAAMRYMHRVATLHHVTDLTCCDESLAGGVRRPWPDTLAG